MRNNAVGADARAGGASVVPRSPRRKAGVIWAAAVGTQAPPGAHTWLEIPVPFPNTAVKQPGPMIVPSAKVG